MRTINLPAQSARAIVCAFELACLLAASPARAASGDIYNLGTFGGTFSYGLGINNAGQVGGWTYTAGNIARNAAVYSGRPGSGGAMNDLGTLGGTNSEGLAINAAGQIAGYSETTGGVTHAFRYTGTPGSGGTMADLGT